MSAKVTMDVDEYLHTSFEGPDCEYLDGEVVERNMGELPHGDVQGNLYRIIQRLRSRLGLRVAPEIRIRITPLRYRIPDISVWRNDNIGERIPTVPPFLAIEILSPEDRITRVLPKIQEYLSIGVEWIWVIDPEDRSALTFSSKSRSPPPSISTPDPLLDALEPVSSHLKPIPSFRGPHPPVPVSRYTKTA